MKPWWKKMGIIACCILCAGVVLSGIGWALGGEIVTLEGSLPDHSAATVQRVLGRIEDAVQIDVLNRVDDEVQDSLQQAREEVESAMQRADDAVQKTMNISGTVLPLTLSDEQSQPLSGDITSVRINVGADRMKILPGESWELSYQLFFPQNLRYEVKNGQLSLSYEWTPGRYRSNGSECIILTVPEDAVLQGVTVEELGRLLYTTGLHLGKVDLESVDVDLQIEDSVLDDVILESTDARVRIEDSQLKALELDTLDLELNLNNLTVDSISVDSTDSDATLRNVTVQGETVLNTADLEMEAGSLTAGTLSISASDGSFTVQNANIADTMQITGADLDTQFAGSAGGSIQIDSSEGDAVLSLDGSAQAYNIDLSAGVDSEVAVAGQKVALQNGQYRKDNGAGRTIEIDTLGDIQLAFAE